MTSTEYIVTGMILCVIAEALLWSSLSAFGYTIHITKPKLKQTERERLRNYMQKDGLSPYETEDICNRMSDEEVRYALWTYKRQATWDK